MGWGVLAAAEASTLLPDIGTDEKGEPSYYVNLYAFTKDKLYDLGDALGITATTRIVPYYSPAANTQVVLILP